MQKYNKPPVDFKLLGKNPCTKSSFTVPVVRKLIKGQYAYNNADGLMEGVEMLLEQTSFTKLFISSERRLVINKLSPCSKSLLLWIMFELKAGNDALWINKDRYYKENDVSINTYKKAIKELIAASIIAKSKVRDVYFINPDYFYNGSRIRKYKKYVLETNKTIE